MEMKDNTIFFSSGRKRYAYALIIGLAQNMDVTYGYDGGFYDGEDGEKWRNEEDKLSKEDMAELADYMIEQWTLFKKSVT